jgi:hypothetical protein
MNIQTARPGDKKALFRGKGIGQIQKSFSNPSRRRPSNGIGHYTSRMFTHKSSKLAGQEKGVKISKIRCSVQMTYGTKEGGTGGFTGNRTPQRVTITLNYAAYKGLEKRSTIEGRSMSNLAAFILERALITDQ